MQLTNKILNILNSITGIKTVIHDTSFSTNVRLDRRETIAAIVFMLQEFNVSVKNGVKRESEEIEIFLCDRCDLAAKGEVVEGVLDGLKPVLNEFLTLVLNERSWVVDGDEINVKMSYGRFDCNVVGYSVELKLTERQGGCIDGDTSGVNQIVITQNGTHNVAAYGEALVNVQGGSIVLQEKTAVANGVVTPDTGYDGLSKVTVQVPQPSGRISVDITRNGTEIWDVANYESIAITTAVPTQTCDLYTGLTVEANGIYDPLTYNKDGFSTFVVNIPQPQGTLQRTISTNGTQTYDVSLWENIEITTNVPTQTCNLYTGLSITQNGTYNPSQYGDYDGFGSISVDVQPRNVGTANLDVNQIGGMQNAQDFGYDYLTGVDTRYIRIGDSVEITENHCWFDALQFGFDLIRSFQVEVPAEQVCQGNLPVTITSTGIETVVCCGYDSVNIDTTQIQGTNTWKGTWAQYQAIFPKDPDTLYLITD